MQRTPIIRFARALAVLATLAALLAQGSAAPQPVAAQSGTCRTHTPPGYTVTVCITQPHDDSDLTGAVEATATVTLSGTSARVSTVYWYLDGEYLLLDLRAPYTFSFPTDHFADGEYMLQVEARLSNGDTTPRTEVEVELENGNPAPPPNPRTFRPVTGSGSVTVAVAGDGAGSRPESVLVGDFIAAQNPDMLLYVGDVYERGTFTEFHNWYGQPWGYGRVRDITNPIVGNHEYLDPGAAGYFYFWDNVPHSYSFDAGGWHIIGLDSTSQFNQLDPGTAQYNWLAADLAANTLPCVMVMFHHPRYSVGPQGNTDRMQAIWALLAQHKVEVALTGHDHSYQRWAALDAAGNPAPGGITQFVAGAGGHGTQSFRRSDARMLSGSTEYGVLLMDLAGGGLSYRYLTVEGAVIDAGTIACDGTAPPTRTPTPTPSATPTLTPSPTPSATPSATPTETPTLTPSATPSATPTETPTLTPSATPTETPTLTPTETPSATPTETPTLTPTETPTEAPTLTPTPEGGEPLPDYLTVKMFLPLINR